MLEHLEERKAHFTFFGIKFQLPLFLLFVYEHVEEIPEAFLFQIQDNKGMNVITLKRTYQNENNEVVVFMPALVTREEPEKTGEGDNGDEHEKPSQSIFRLQWRSLR